MKFPLKNTNTKNVFLLIGSIVLSKGLVLICTPFITRLYDPYLFGILAFILSFGRILGVIFSMRYELKFLNVDNENRFDLLKFLNAHVYRLFLLSAAVTFLIVFGLDLPKQYLLIPFFALLTCLYEVNRMYNVADKKFNQIAVSEIVRGINQGLVPLIAFFSALFVPIGLVVSELSALIGSIFSMAGHKILTSLQSFTQYKTSLKGAYR